MLHNRIHINFIEGERKEVCAVFFLEYQNPIQIIAVKKSLNSTQL